MPLFFLAAQEKNQEDEPEWVLFQKGLGKYHEKDYSAAFMFFRKTTEKKDFPEAEYWIGKIFENEGEYTLALKQYERALMFSSLAGDEGFELMVLYSMAGVYAKQENYNLYSRTLEKIINDVKLKMKTDAEYEAVLSDRIIGAGIDKLIYYFRHEGDPLVRAYGELGIYYFSHSRDRSALRNLVSAVMIIFSESIKLLRDYDPQYEYSNFRTLIKESESDNTVKQYLIDSDFYKYLFYLSLTLDNLGEHEQARYIFSVLSESTAKNRYNEMALRIRNNNYSAPYKDGIKKALLVPVKP